MSNKQYPIPYESSPGSGSGGGTATINFARATLTSAQIVAGGAGPTVVAAPGVGKYIVPLFAIFNYKFITAPYSISGTVNIQLISGVVSWADVDAAGFLDAAGDQVSTSFPSAFTTASYPPTAVALGQTQVAESSLDNQALSLTANSGATGGSGTVDVLVWYQTVTKA